MAKFPLVRVDWVDSAFTQGWRLSYQKVYASDCSTVGYLVAKTKKHVAVAMNINEDGGYGDTMAIPRSVVKRIRRLRHGRK